MCVSELEQSFHNRAVGFYSSRAGRCARTGRPQPETNPP